MATTEQPPKDSHLGTPGMLSERDSSDTSMMPQQEPKAAPKAGLMTRLREEINPVHSDLPVLATCFVSGICDSVAFNASSVFVSMQTGKSPSRLPLDPLVSECHRLVPTDMSSRQHHLPRSWHSKPPLRCRNPLAQGARLHRLLLGGMLLLQPVAPCRTQGQGDPGRLVLHPVRLHSHRRGGLPERRGPCICHEVSRHCCGARAACKL